MMIESMTNEPSAREKRTGLVFSPGASGTSLPATANAAQAINPLPVR
jgi:hypothetical protein